jgi:FKBP-type peptidyl-prolyl cis-trans isomerase
MTKFRPLSVAILSLLVVTSACTVGDSLGSSAPATVEGTTFAPSLGIDLSKMTRSEHGDYTLDVTIGSGAVVQTGDSISVKYTGWLSDGTQFGSNMNTSDVYGVRLGAGNVIPGWEESVPGMRVGGTRLIIVPPSMAYGFYTIGTIPGNSVLVFTVKVVGNP